jgi:hypothetical protein
MTDNLQMILDFDEAKELVLKRLGHPIRTVEINDEQFLALYKIAHEEFGLYHALGIKKLDESVKKRWLLMYFTALSKELLGRIREKFINPSDLTLDFKSLLEESREEKEHLIKLLLEEINTP